MVTSKKEAFSRLILVEKFEKFINLRVLKRMKTFDV